jgi:hypothetical protein
MMWQMVRMMCGTAPVFCAGFSVRLTQKYGNTNLTNKKPQQTISLAKGSMGDP